MKLLNVRSPYVIEVNEVTSDGSKLEVFIWNAGSTEPPATWQQSTLYTVGNTLSYGDNYYQVTFGGTTSTTPPTHTTGTVANGTAQLLFTGSATSTNTKIYTLSKSNPSLTQKSTQYNISNLVKDYIDNVWAASNTLSVENTSNWAWVRVKRYNLVGAAYTLLDNTLYTSVNGFTQFKDGLNKTTTVTSLPALLANANINYLIKDNTTNFLNVFVPSGTYNWQNNTLIITDAITVSDYTMLKIPIKEGANLFFDNTFTLAFTVNATRIDEAKYTPVVCRFENRSGGWDFITFFKAKTNSISSTRTEYKVLPSALNYDYKKGQKKTFNIIGQESVKLNTGWVDENYSSLIEDLILSETIFLDDLPVTIKTTASELKATLNNKMINYEVEFDYAFSLINDQI